MFAPSVVVDDLDVEGVSFTPNEADSPLVVDPDAVLTNRSGLASRPRTVSRAPGALLRSAPHRRRITNVAQYRYTVILEREDDGGFHAFVPALRGCHTQGDSEAEALANAQEAIAVYLESLKAHGETVAF
jgi:predicted RNase H-like HicB family nuclease